MKKLPVTIWRLAVFPLSVALSHIQRFFSRLSYSADEGIKQQVFRNETFLDGSNADTIIAAVYPAWFVVPGHKVIEGGSIIIKANDKSNPFFIYLLS